MSFFLAVYDPKHYHLLQQNQHKTLKVYLPKTKIPQLPKKQLKSSKFFSTQQAANFN